MRPAAIGIRMHSGWGAAVVLASQVNEIELLERRRMSVAAPSMKGAKQPYHFVETLPLAAAERCLAEITQATEALAAEAMGELVREVEVRGYQVASAGILLSSARSLPPLARILGSHAYIHAAEGEFFRGLAWRVCERMHMHVAGFRERGLEEEAKQFFGRSFPETAQKLARMGKSAGPPWTLDQKSAAWAALMALGELH